MLPPEVVDLRRRRLTLLDVESPDLDRVIPAARRQGDAVDGRQRERAESRDAVGVRAVGHEGEAFSGRGLCTAIG